MLQEKNPSTLTYQERENIFQVSCNYMSWRDFTSAARVLHFLIHDNPDEPRNYYAYSMCALQRGHFGEAFSVAYICYLNNPHSARGFSLLIETLLKLDEPDATALAIDHFNSHFKDYTFLAARYEPIRSTLDTPEGTLEDHLAVIHQARNLEKNLFKQQGE